MNLELTRRQALRNTFAFGAATALTPTLGSLSGCVPPADGTFERPFTREDPGEWADKIEIHIPRVFAALVDDTRLRIWVEVEDDAGTPHEQTEAHFVSRLLVTDQDGAVFSDLSFSSEADARLIFTADIPATTTELKIFEACNLHGVWLQNYDVAALRVPPIGDLRTPLTPEQPGEWSDKIAVHIPFVFVGEQGLVVEVGDRASDKLHVMTDEHYIDAVTVLDQNNQVIAEQLFSPSDAEPAFTIATPPGTTTVRVIASCNLHDWWEGSFSVGGP